MRIPSFSRKGGQWRDEQLKVIVFFNNRTKCTDYLVFCDVSHFHFWIPTLLKGDANDFTCTSTKLLFNHLLVHSILLQEAETTSRRQEKNSHIPCPWYNHINLKLPQSYYNAPLHFLCITTFSWDYPVRQVLLQVFSDLSLQIQRKIRKHFPGLVTFSKIKVLLWCRVSV